MEGARVEEYSVRSSRAYAVQLEGNVGNSEKCGEVEPSV